MDQTVTKDKKFQCLECSNEVEVDSALKPSDYFECPFCGIEYEVVEKQAEGEFVAKIVEEEK